MAFCFVLPLMLFQAFHLAFALTFKPFGFDILQSPIVDCLKSPYTVNKSVFESFFLGVLISLEYFKNSLLIEVIRTAYLFLYSWLQKTFRGTCLIENSWNILLLVCVYCWWILCFLINFQENRMDRKTEWTPYQVRSSYLKNESPIYVLVVL